MCHGCLQIPLPPVDEKKKVIEDVTKDRRYSIDAAIVRTMKSRKMMQHQQLTMEVVQQLSRMFQVGILIILGLVVPKTYKRADGRGGGGAAMQEVSSMRG